MDLLATVLGLWLSAWIVKRVIEWRCRVARDRGEFFSLFGL